MQVDYGTSLSIRRISALDPKGCVIVKHVDPKSAAWGAGLRAGVIISHVATQRVNRPLEFFDAVDKETHATRLSTFDVNGRSTIVID